MKRGVKSRALALVDATVVRSLPSRCDVCTGRRRVQLVRLGVADGGGPMSCPHCAAGHWPIPIRIYPMRTDMPRPNRGGAA